jgi:phage terminase large subunit-like protein
MTLKATSARYMPSLAEVAALELQRLRSRKTEQTLQKAVKPYSPHQPFPKQRAFLELDAQEVTYGGAAAGGKSDAVLMAALQYVDRPNYSALLLRHREVDLYKAGAILDRAKQWFAGTAAKWDADLLGFRFPTYDSNAGAAIGFGHLTTVKDRERWRGPEFQFIGVEELTEWEEGNYTFLFSRLRSVDAKVPTRMRANTNPGGIGHEWVKARFVSSARQLGTGLAYNAWRTGDRGGSPVFESPPSTQVLEMARRLGVRPQGAYFVPAFAEDNPYLDRKGYLMNLAQLDPTEFEWYANGDWDAQPSGDIFEREWFGQYLDVEPSGEGVHWCRYWDLAGTDPNDPGNEKKDPAYSAGVKVGLQWLANGAARVIIGDAVRDRLKPGDVELFVKATAEIDGKGTRQVFELEPGSSGIAVVNGYATRTLLGWDVYGHRKTGAKEEMWRPLAGLARAGGLWLMHGPWNRDFVNELVGLPKGKKDQADAAAGGYAWLLDKHPPPPPPLEIDATINEEMQRDSPWSE